MQGIPYSRVESQLAPAPSPALLQPWLQQAQVAPSLKDLEQAISLLTDAHHRRSQGAVYTPNDIIDYLIEAGATHRHHTSPRPPVVMDCACGSAGFLIRAAAYLEAHAGLSPETIVRDHLIGVDNDPLAIQSSRCLLDLYLATRHIFVDPAEFRLFQEDTLLTPAQTLLERVGADGGVDLLVTNPPYVKIQTMNPDYRQQLSERFPSLAQGNFSLSSLFLAQGLALLQPGGVMGCITQNNLFTSLAGRAVRRTLQEQRALVQIVDFGHHKVFSNASAYTCLLLLSRTPATTFSWASMTTSPPTLPALRALSFDTLPHAALDPTRWRLMPPHHARNIRQIESTGTPLGRLAQIRVGIATLCDSVYLTRPTGTHCVPLDPQRRGAIETAITRPLQKVADLTADPNPDPDTAPLRVIFPYQRREGRYSLIEEHALRDQFPGAWRWLCQNRALLAARDRGRKDYGAWYGWGRRQSMEAPGPKLLTKTFSQGPAFFFDRSDALFCNGYSVQLRGSDEGGQRLALLQHILNSTIMDYYARLTSFQIDGDYQCFQKNFIERFGIPPLDDAQGWMALPAPERDRALAQAYGVPWLDIAEICRPPSGEGGRGDQGVGAGAARVTP